MSGGMQSNPKEEDAVKKTVLVAALLGMITALAGCGGYEGDEDQLGSQSESLLPGGGGPPVLNCYTRICQCYSCEYVGQTFQLPTVPQSCETRCALYAKSQAHAGCTIRLMSTTRCP